jgi:hypothetical protein
MSGSTSRSSGLKSADALIRTGPVILAGVHIITDQTNDLTLTIYDNTAASGTEVFKQIVTGENDSIPYSMPDNGIYCKNGIYADVTGTGAEYIVFFK